VIILIIVIMHIFLSSRQQPATGDGNLPAGQVPKQRGRIGQPICVCKSFIFFAVPKMARPILVAALSFLTGDRRLTTAPVWLIAES
jgi:hypothetical protein